MYKTGFAAFQKSVFDFCKTNTDETVGILAKGLSDSGFDTSALQRESWESQINQLKEAFNATVEFNPNFARASVILEFTIPVLRKRIDTVILFDDKIIVIEYKGGSTTSGQTALSQAQDYALDLLDFHEPSKDRKVFPIALGEFDLATQQKNINSKFVVRPNQLPSLLNELISLPVEKNNIDPNEWVCGRYFPVPSVIEAATTAFNDHSVSEIAMSRADPDSLERSKKVLLSAVTYAQSTNSKVLCVLTGVPGAGKTLAGLNAVSSILSELSLEKEQAAYLSGNNPLVNVLRDALYRNFKQNNRTITRSRLNVLIQEMHRFVADNFITSAPPATKMIVFDEAQRAWSKEKNQKKFNRDLSEPEMVFQIMNRHTDWAVIVALVGGGQEIHSGEAGLEEWGEAIVNNPNWEVWASKPSLEGGPAVANTRLFSSTTSPKNKIKALDDLHLNVSIRSIDAEDSAAWVNAVLGGNTNQAAEIAKRHLPIYLCRDVETMRGWLLQHQQGTRRTGILASSGAERLRALGIETPTFTFIQGISYVNWFLEPAGDVRSSNQLEVALSEFEVQGLELDYVGLIWGGDFLFKNGKPVIRKFRNNSWQTFDNQSSDEKTQRQIIEAINRYRVLLTRYRKAMVICVPHGSYTDLTRIPEEFDATFEFLKACGAQPIENSLPTVI